MKTKCRYGNNSRLKSHWTFSRKNTPLSRIMCRRCRWWYRCFLAPFFRYPFYRKAIRHCFCSTEEYFANKIVNNKTFPKQLITKTLTYAEKNLLRTSSFHILLLFKNVFIPLFSAFHYTLKKLVFRNNAVPLRTYLL